MTRAIAGSMSMAVGRWLSWPASVRRASTAHEPSSPSSYLAAGGIATHEADVGEAGVGEAWHGSKADFAVICSSDPLYERHAGAIAAALKAAGSAIVLLAGRPGAGEVAWRDSGIDYFIHVGDDMLATLRHVAREIGMIE